MHRTAFRTCLTRSNIRWQTLPASAFQSTWQPQQQPLGHCRRRFHASSPKQSIILAPIELLEYILPFYLVLPLAAFLPHYLRHKFQIRIVEEQSERLAIAKPLGVVHHAVLTQRMHALSRDVTSTAISEDQLRQIGRINQDFSLKFLNKHAAPYSVWEKRTLVPPALHVAWTAINVWGLRAGAAIPPPVLGISHTLMENTTAHALVCVGLAIGFVFYLGRNLFWQSFDPHYVQQMPPGLRLSYGLNTAVYDRTSGFVMPRWFSRLRDALDVESIETKASVKTFEEGFADKDHTDKATAFTLCFVGAFVISWGLSVPQAIYLILAFFAAVIGKSSTIRYQQKLILKSHKRNSKWLPLTPRFPKR